jgi:sec-independent protein translocase protein TatB
VFDFGFSELLLIAVVGLLVLGPERLPRAARTGGLWLRRARSSWYSVKAQFERELADDELRRSLQQTREEFDGLRKTLQKPLEDPTAPPPRSAGTAATADADADQSAGADATPAGAPGAPSAEPADTTRAQLPDDPSGRPPSDLPADPAADPPSAAGAPRDNR